MINWNGVMESLHSSLIDELIDRFPKTRPELKMPSRRNAWELLPDMTQAVVCDLVHVAQKHEDQDQRGIGAISMNDAAGKLPGSSLLQFWEALFKRAQPDLTRRSLTVIPSTVVELDAGLPLPATFIQPTRVIWIPIQVNDAAFGLGIGI